MLDSVFGFKVALGLPATLTSPPSGNGGGNCVEVARDIPGIVAVRDSNDPHGPVLTLGAGVWRGLSTT
jgi:hypothetical protein